ncbi:transcriptional regulator ATRX-like protein [Senna tora]|uniref:Transcriptional regulator ATRX-like protein n=1 Tax=Senna tora TaxID=362788 RepID=A0A834X2Y5_9FABA|nr:transcriptional regulator ATRX-like protein [Senna tora]
MGKSSASLKKKRAKKSSKVRGSSKSKSKRYKSKKLRRRKVPLSSSDYDDSTSSETSLSSSPEDGYRSRRARSSKRKDEKGRRKKAKPRRHSLSHESSEDSLRDRKRKRAKRKIEHDTREKLHKKKKLRKESSVGSMSSESWSCSTCQGDSAGSDKDEFESHRGRSERKGKGKQSERSRSGSERISRYRARSCSSCSCSSESNDKWTEEKYVSNNNSRRLRSVITVTEEAEETRELFRNEDKEEIVNDHDYPCRSNDSNDGGSKRESAEHSLPASKEKVGIRDENVDENTDFNLREPKIKDRSYNDSNEYERSKLDVYGGGTSGSVEKKTSETSGASLNGDDLESILRQRALENLRKFRGQPQSSAKASGLKEIGSDVNQTPVEKYELVEGKSTEESAAVGTNFDKKTHVEELTLSSSGRRNSIVSSRNNEKNLNSVNGKSVSVKHHSTFAPKKAIDAENHSATITASTRYQIPASGREKLVVTMSTTDKHTSDTAHFPSCSIPNLRCDNSNKEQNEVKEHSQTKFESKQTSDSHEPHHTKIVGAEGNVNQNAVKTDAAIQSVNNRERDFDKLCVSATAKPCAESSSVEASSNKLQGEASQGSQFEQKTMNVMRGGEMVQVSYKVYIPKKAPALARRQLKR